MNFSSFAGNPDAKALLSADVDNGRFSHALLLEGLAGSGRRTLARLLAAAAVCERPDGAADKPCGVCPACRKAAAGIHPDIVELGGDGGARSFHIDTVRELRETAYLLPNEAPRRCIILTNVGDMTEQAQNALLKLLEEPPPHLVFILTCENRAELLPTVQSRLRTVALAGVSEEEALPLLRTRLPDTDDAMLRQALAVYGGRIGQVLDALSDGSFRQVQELARDMAAAIVSPQEAALLKLTAVLQKDKALTDGVLSAMLLIVRDSLAKRAGFAGRLSSSPETAEQLANRLSGEQLMALIDTLEGLQHARVRNMNHTLFLTLLCARLRQAAGRG